MMAPLPTGSGHVFLEGLCSSPYQVNLPLNRLLPITPTYRSFCGAEPSAGPVTQLVRQCVGPSHFLSVYSPSDASQSALLLMLISKSGLVSQVAFCKDQYKMLC